LKGITVKAEATIKPGQIKDGHTVGYWIVLRNTSCPDCFAKKNQICTVAELHNSRWAIAFKEGLLK
jgi:D-arabinose 1-dehydrogenase-like Zn-dependent alcohol dehydrogenase